MAINPEFIERYQMEYQKNPQSRIFAPLAEAYRKMGLLEEAFQVCSKGVVIHPDFPGGRVAFAKVLLDRKQFEDALVQLEKAVQLSPDNLLAHMLMGEILLELRRPKEALKAFKMVLFLSPSDERALKAVKKWEFLTADEYEADVFEMRPLFAESQESRQGYESAGTAASPGAGAEPAADPAFGLGAEGERGPPSDGTAYTMDARDLDRLLSLADAFTVRNDIERAQEILQNARKSLGNHPEIVNRLSLLSRRTQTVPDEEPEALEPLSESQAEAFQQTNPNASFADLQEREATAVRKIARLQTFLRRIDQRRSDPQ